MPPHIRRQLDINRARLAALYEMPFKIGATTISAVLNQACLATESVCSRTCNFHECYYHQCYAELGVPHHGERTIAAPIESSRLLVLLP